MTASEILKNSRLSKGFTQEALAEMVNISHRSYQRYEEGLFPKYKNDKIRELDTILGTKLYDMIYDSDALRPVTQDPAPSYLSERRIRKNIETPYLVPFVDIPAQAGYSKAYSNIDYIQTLKMYPILPDVDPMGAVWRYFQVEGDSMEEEIRNKDVLLTSLVPAMDWPDIKDFYTHVVVTEDQVLIKDVLKEGDDNIILLSTNPHYDPVRLDLKEVKQIWVMRRHVKNRVKKKMYDLEEIKRKLKAKKS